MSPNQLISTEDTLQVLLKQYRSNKPMSKAQLDCLVQYGVLNERNGSYSTGPRAASLSGSK